MNRMIKGTELKAGQTIKANRRICKVVDIEEADELGARLADIELTGGEFQTVNFFDDSEYELRKDPAAPRRRRGRHPALVTSDRLLVAYETWHDRLSADSLTAIGKLRTELQDIAEQDEEARSA